MSSSILFSKEDYENATNVIVQFLRDSGYDGSLEAGTSISDTVIKPNALLYALYDYMAEKAKAYQSLQLATDMHDAGSLDDSEYDSAVDCILSNWFVTRNPGEPCKGKVRLWFLHPQEYVSYSDGETVADCGGLTLVADGDQTFGEVNFSSVVNAVTNYEEYYIDVLTRATENTDDQPLQGASVTASFSDVDYLRATLPENFTSGTSQETTSALIERTSQAITTREMVTSRAIDLTLKEEFGEIRDLYVAGHGYDEQVRDYVVINSAKIHYGNKADIWVASDMSVISLEFPVDDDGVADTSSFPEAGHLGMLVDENQTFYYEEPDRCLWGSAGYVPTIKSLPNTTLTCKCVTDPLLASIQAYVSSEERRVICYDPLVRHKLPVLMRFNVSVELYSATDDEIAEAKETVTETIKDYVNSLCEGNADYVESELVGRIQECSSNVKKVTIPLSCTASLYDPERNDTQTVEANNKFRLEGYSKLSVQVTSNTTQLFTDGAFIEVSCD